MSDIIRKRFEQLMNEELNIHLNKIGSSFATIRFLAELTEQSYPTGNFAAGDTFSSGLEALIPLLKASNETAEPGTEQWKDDLIAACLFGADYDHLQDLVYYSYANLGRVRWEEKDGNINIFVDDPTVLRQIASERQAFFLNSMANRSEDNSAHTIMSLLRGTMEWDLEGEKFKKAYALIEKEVLAKIAHYFSYIAAKSTVPILEYRYNQFFEIYKSLLEMAMYSRYYSKSNELSYTISYSETELVAAIIAQADITAETCRKILRDIATSSRQSFIFLPEISSYLLLPFSFSLKDGIAAILKLYVSRDPNGFSRNCSPAIGPALVKKVAGYFAPFKNFKVLTEVKLLKFNPSLPDIDLIAISYEPSLGFHFFICEIKNNLPASNGKELLKAAGKQGVVKKALSQMEKISSFIPTEVGAQFLVGLAIREFKHLDLKKLFPSGIVCPIDHVVITQQSIGMFFPESTTTIINDDLFRHVMLNSDGDVNYIRTFLRSMDETLDNTYSVLRNSIVVSQTLISYDSASLTAILQFPKHAFLSAGALESLEEESLRTGYRFIDTWVGDDPVKGDTESA